MVLRWGDIIGVPGGGSFDLTNSIENPAALDDAGSTYTHDLP
jgi:hypothetical protein